MSSYSRFHTYMQSCGPPALFQRASRFPFRVDPSQLLPKFYFIQGSQVLQRYTEAACRGYGMNADRLATDDVAIRIAPFGYVQIVIAHKHVLSNVTLLGPSKQGRVFARASLPSLCCSGAGPSRWELRLRAGYECQIVFLARCTRN